MRGIGVVGGNFDVEVPNVQSKGRRRERRIRSEEVHGIVRANEKGLRTHSHFHRFGPQKLRRLRFVSFCVLFVCVLFVFDAFGFNFQFFVEIVCFKLFSFHW